jgi:aspartate dehydrogenase
MSDLRVGIIGPGTIGRAVGDALASGAVPGAELAGYLGRRGGDFSTLDELLAAGPGVVVEAASHDAVREYAEPVLASGVDLVCISVGALADEELRARLLAAARDGGSRLVVPSGAVGGLDLLRSAAEGGLEEVVIEQRKPPAALLPAEEAATLAEPRVVFDGTVGAVVSLYPKTTNVAAAVALAGLGFDATRAVVVADPTLRANRAILTARGSFGTVRLQLDNIATANPRTSVVAAQSVLAALRRLREPLLL